MTALDRLGVPIVERIMITAGSRLSNGAAATPSSWAPRMSAPPEHAGAHDTLVLRLVRFMKQTAEKANWFTRFLEWFKGLLGKQSTPEDGSPPDDRYPLF